MHFEESVFLGGVPGGRAVYAVCRGCVYYGAFRRSECDLLEF